MDGCSLEDVSDKMLSPIETFSYQVQATQNCYAGFTKYLNEFLVPYLIATNYFNTIEQDRLLSTSPLDSIQSYAELMEFNMDLMNRYMIGTMRAINEFNNRERQNAMSAWMNTIFRLDGEDIEAYAARLSRMMGNVAHTYPKAIMDIESEFGFHFEREINPKVAETDRFILYQVMPTDNGVEVNNSGKPILIIPPFVLGANILAFLPGEKRSYAHSYANQGIPTYIRVLKDIATTPAMQVMTPEDDANDTRIFCGTIMQRHGKPVTLNGYCQGGFSAVCNMLSGELDGLVDALITCVAPMDGTRSKGLSGFLGSLPKRFNDLAYGTKSLSNGNRVADGKLMGWVYKLKSIENESPVVAFLRDAMLLSPKGDNNGVRISKSAAAINYWLQNERSDLPLGITQMSYDSYNHPVTDDGTLPIKLFGRKLNFKRIKEKGIPWLICYGERDDLVEKETALAPLDFIEAELSGFPKGHVAIATSWSNPRSACALHTVFGERKYRGPVRFQIDLDREMDDARAKATAKPAVKRNTVKATGAKKNPARAARKQAGKEKV
jgi:hypothetical protein